MGLEDIAPVGLAALTKTGLENKILQPGSAAGRVADLLAQLGFCILLLLWAAPQRFHRL